MITQFCSGFLIVYRILSENLCLVLGVVVGIHLSYVAFIMFLSPGTAFGYENYKNLSIQHSYLGDGNLGGTLICI